MKKPNLLLFYIVLILNFSTKPSDPKKVYFLPSPYDKEAIIGRVYECIRTSTKKGRRPGYYKLCTNTNKPLSWVRCNKEGELIQPKKSPTRSRR